MERLTPEPHITEYFRPRIRIALIVILALMAVLLARLWRLQIVEGEYFDRMARENRIRLIRTEAPRGRILDANGRELALNRPGLTIAATAAATKRENARDIIRTLRAPLGINEERFRELIRKTDEMPNYMTYPLKRNLSLEQVSLIKTRSEGLRGLSLETRPLRVYPEKSVLCHVLGNLGQVSAPELERNAAMGYRPGDYIGKTGLEKEYENVLRGIPGWERIEIDARGRRLGKKMVREALAGAQIVLTIDLEFQKFVEEAFIHRAGSVIAVDPDTGRILAMVSKPGYDLNLFTPSISRRQWNNLNNDPLHPLENRAIRGLYPPASVFKMVLAAAGLSEKIIDPSNEITCNGKFHVGGLTFRCWKRTGHGKVDLRRAVVESCDPYFYELGLKLGPEKIARHAALFGLGRPTGVGLPQELPGLIPTPSWKVRNYGEIWRDGETVTTSIGQGYVVCTPVQLAMMTAVFASRGNVMKPAIVDTIKAHNGEIVYKHDPVVRWKVPLAAKDWDMLRDALVGVVSSPRGTGKNCGIKSITVAGKTGTSQVIRSREGTQISEQTPYHERAHAIFTAYVDDRPKKIAVAVIVEHGGGGGETAAPIAKKVIQKYYGIRDEPDDSEENKNVPLQED